MNRNMQFRTISWGCMQEFYHIFFVGKRETFLSRRLNKLLFSKLLIQNKLPKGKYFSSSMYSVDMMTILSANWFFKSLGLMSGVLTFSNSIYGIKTKQKSTCSINRS